MEKASSRGLSGMQKGFILLAVSVLILAGAVYALYTVYVKPVDLEEPVMDSHEAFTPPTVTDTQVKIDKDTGKHVVVEVERPASHKEDFYNILVVGTDDDGTRTDTIIIARIDVQAHTVALLSIPRDTVIAGNYNVPKINSVYGANGKGEKGMEALQSKLAQLLGFEVDGYALVNLKAFIELVDLVGGVEYDVPMDMHYEDPSQDLYIHLDAGLQHLDGEHAMQLVRFRKGYATQDIGRTQTQQSFLKELAKTCLEEVNVVNIGRMSEIFKENVMTDMTLGNIAYFGQELLKCDFENMFTYTLEGEGVSINEASCWAIYLNNTLEVVNEYFNPYEAPITAANVTIRTPAEIRAEQAAAEAEKEAAEAEEEEDLFEELPEETIEEPGEAELPTDDWIVEGEEDMAEEFWP